MIDVARRFGKGLFVLVRTSNPGSAEVQDGVHERVARMVDALGADGVGTRGYADVGAVTGLTYPDEASALRALMPRAILLVPGLGAQGGRPEDFARFLDDDGLARSRRLRGASRARGADAHEASRRRRRCARPPAGSTRHERCIAASVRDRGQVALVARQGCSDGGGTPGGRSIRAGGSSGLSGGSGRSTPGGISTFVACR